MENGKYNGIFTGKRRGNYFIQGDHVQIMTRIKEKLDKGTRQIPLAEFMDNADGSIEFSDKDIEMYETFLTEDGQNSLLGIMSDEQIQMPGKLPDANGFDDFLVRCLGMTKVGHRTDPENIFQVKYVATSDPTPHITFEKVFKEDNFYLVQVEPLDKTEDGQFRPKEFSMMQLRADADRREKIEMERSVRSTEDNSL